MTNKIKMIIYKAHKNAKEKNTDLFYEIKRLCFIYGINKQEQQQIINYL